MPTEAELAVMKKKREEAMKGYYDPKRIGGPLLDLVGWLPARLAQCV